MSNNVYGVAAIASEENVTVYIDFEALAETHISVEKGSISLSIPRTAASDVMAAIEGSLSDVAEE